MTTESALNRIKGHPTVYIDKNYTIECHDEYASFTHHGVVGDGGPNIPESIAFRRVKKNALNTNTA